jgi:hypothetical protein
MNVMKEAKAKLSERSDEQIPTIHPMEQFSDIYLRNVLKPRREEEGKKLSRAEVECM